MKRVTVHIRKDGECNAFVLIFDICCLLSLLRPRPFSLNDSAIPLLSYIRDLPQFVSKAFP